MMSATQQIGVFQQPRNTTISVLDVTPLMIYDVISIDSEKLIPQNE